MLLDTWAGRGLRLFRMRFNADALATVAAHPTAAGLRWLDFAYAQLSAEAVRLLATAPCLTRGTTLIVGNNPFGDGGLSELLRWPGLCGLRKLHLGGCGLTNAGMEQLAASPAVANIRQLFLAHNRIGVAGGKALAESPYLGKLKELSLYDNPVRDAPAVVKAIRQRFGRKTSF